MPIKKEQKSSDIAKLYKFLKPFKLQIFFALIALITTAATILLFGNIIKYLIDYGFVARDEKSIYISLITFIAAVIIMSIAGYYRSSLINSVAQKAIANIRKDVYAHIIKISPKYFESNKTGDIISRLTSDTTLLFSIISNTISFFLRNTIFLS